MDQGSGFGMVSLTITARALLPGLVIEAKPQAAAGSSLKHKHKRHKEDTFMMYKKIRKN